MNKLITDINGKFPLYLDDIRWIDSSVRDSFKGNLAGFGESKFIISGCEITIDQAAEEMSCSPGYLYYDGEIIYTTGGTVSTAQPNVPVFELEITYDAAGYKLFGNGVLNNTYQIRRGKFVSVIDTTDKLDAASAKRYHELIYSNIRVLSEYIADMAVFAKKTQEDWTVVVPSSEFEFANLPIAERLKWRKDNFGQLQLVGSIQGGADPNGAAICQIPNIAPLTDRWFTVFVDNSPTGSRVILPCWLEEGGTVRINQLDGTVSPGGIAYFNATIPLN